MQIFFILFLAAALCACTNMNSTFDCPKKPGISCHSLSEVNLMVKKNIVGKRIGLKTQDKKNEKYYVLKKKAQPFNVLRSQEKTMPIWIAPYQDKDGNYHEKSLVYTIVKKSEWRVPVAFNEFE